MQIFLKLLVILTLSAMAISATAQQRDFDPFPKNNASLYHLDFTQYFSNEESEKKDLNSFYLNLNRFSLLKSKINGSAIHLLTALKMQDSLLIQFFRHYIYHNLLGSVNRNYPEGIEFSDRLEANFNAKTFFFEKELMELSPQKLEQYMVLEPGLKKYDFYLKKLLRNKEYQLNDSTGETINQLLPAISGWQYEMYETIGRNITFPGIETPGGTLNVKKDMAAIRSHADSSVRRKGFTQLYDGYNSMRDLYAFALIKLANAADENAGLHHFTDAPEMFYFDKYQSKQTINKILKQLVDSVAVYKHYQKIVLEYKKKQLPSKQVKYWDMEFNPGLVQPRFTIDSARQIILSTLQPLGEDYKKELLSLLDPVNRRMEIAPDKNKRSGGFSRGFIKTNSIFFTGGYKGYYDDVRVLAHESTHAIHRQLMNSNNVLPVYADGPNYLFESFAIFSEFLLSDYLIQQTNSKEEKQYYLEQYFKSKGMVMFSAATDALLEQNIHEGVKNGTINGADDLDSLNEKINNQFSIWDSRQFPQLNQRWITDRLIYEDPFYEVNYVLGAMLALKYYELYQRDRNSFYKNYARLLKNGFTEDPQSLLKHYLDIDISKPGSLVTDAIKVTNTKVNELEELYK